MDLTDLANSIKEYLRPGSTAIRTAPGQTYGPSVSIQGGHVPIQYKIMNGKTTGEYQTYFDKPTNPFSSAPPTATPHITIDPTTQDFKTVYGNNVNPVIHHEVAHAILEKPRTYQGVTGNTNYDVMASENPAYEPILSRLTSRVVNPSEVPAYMSESGAAARWGIPQNLIDLYRNRTASQLSPEARAEYVKNLGR